MSIAIGLNRGHRFIKHVRTHTCRKGVNGNQRRICHEVIREVAGYAPYERRVLELLRNGFDKRALRLCKKKLGTMIRAKHKRDELTGLMQKARLERLAQLQAGKEHEGADEKGKKEKAKDKKKAKTAEKKEAKKKEETKKEDSKKPAPAPAKKEEKKPEAKKPEEKKPEEKKPETK